MTALQPSRHVDVCICTFRRPQLAATLRSLQRIAIPDGISLGVIVADNDDTPTAQALVESVAAEIGLPLRYIHCPARNISLARNACLDASDAPLIAFIDDDEVATHEWLVGLLAVMDRESAEVVLGPVRARYEPDAPGWMRRGDFHSTTPVWVKGTIRTGYTCNVLMRRDGAGVRGRRFALSRGQTGGEDTTFFAEITDDGGVIAFAPDAWVEEDVPVSRASFGWLAKRRFRMGQTHGRLIGERTSRARRATQAGLALTKVAYCGLAALATLPHPVARNRSLLRGVLHVGTIGGLIGVQELRQYGAPSAETPRHAA
jgi:succinoglycan biosynthesis protein ExoM